MNRYYAMSKGKVLKQLNINPNSPPMYSNITMPRPNNVTYYDKGCHDGSYFATIPQDNAQYFELDQALVNPPNVNQV